MSNNSKANPGHEESLRAKKAKVLQAFTKKVVYVEGFHKKRQSDNCVTGPGVEIILVCHL